MNVTRSMSDIFQPLASILARNGGEASEDAARRNAEMQTSDPRQDEHKASGEPMPRKKISFRE